MKMNCLVKPLKNKILLLLFSLVLFRCVAGDNNININKSPFTVPEGIITVTFSVTADISYFAGENKNHFRGVCERIKYGGKGDFMVSAGDIAPPDKTYSTIKKYISNDYVWYPVVGNHEILSESFMRWLRSYNKNGNTLPNIVKSGPEGAVETTFSFNYENAHFIIINQYHNGAGDTETDGDISDSLYHWLEQDLEMNGKPVVFIFGHEPAYPKPDKESGRERHVYNSLDAHPIHRDRFWGSLKTNEVSAYVCGHTHNYSTFFHDGVWQVDVGHARGTGDPGSKSTFVMFYIMADNSVWMYTYRLNKDSYLLYEKIKIK